MTITRETLELAAKAAGCEIRDIRGVTYINKTMLTNGDWWNAKPWSPMIDDGDSARLRTDLSLNVDWDNDLGMVAVLEKGEHISSGYFQNYADHNNDKHAALRYAALMVAAEIGRRMK